MAFNCRFPDGRDFDLVIPRRVTSPTTMTGIRGPDGQDAAMWFEKANGAGTLPTANMRNTSGQDLNQVLALKIDVTVTATGGTAVYDNGNSGVPNTRPLTTSATATASGGTGSYTYLWEITSVSNVTGASISGATTPTVNVTATASLNVLGRVNLRCTVTSGGATAVATTSCSYNYYNNV